jgi:hypothetical protein
LTVFVCSLFLESLLLEWEDALAVAFVVALADTLAKALAVAFVEATTCVPDLSEAETDRLTLFSPAITAYAIKVAAMP